MNKGGKAMETLLTIPVWERAEEYEKMYNEELEKNDRLLQKNKQLKEEIQELRADYGNKAQIERDLLQLRIDKAIEYIYNHQPVFELSSKEQIQEWFEKEYYVELLEILKGDSNE